MKINDVPDSLIIKHCNVYDDDMDLIKLYKESAKSYIKSYTGLDDDGINKYEDLTIVYLNLISDMYDNRSFTVENDKENKMILCIMKDITKERKHKDQIHNAQIEAARMADKLVEEQLKIVQQIAGLLGETAADTKVAVEKLKNTILLESEEENEKK